MLCYDCRLFLLLRARVRPEENRNYLVSEIRFTGSPDDVVTRLMQLQQSRVRDDEIIAAGAIALLSPHQPR
jgi:hypothetical protein